MSEPAALRVVSTPHSRGLEVSSEWGSSSAPVVVGKDVLELLSTSMYVDAMTIYREYIQNAADAIDEARAQRSLSEKASGQVDITIDVAARLIRIRDNGTGIAWAEFAERLINLGSSAKRGTAARGFRGVGRLAGLGYCQELIFRSRVEGESQVSELRWDCRALKSALRTARQTQLLETLIRDIVSVRRVTAENQPKRFFEVVLSGVIRHRNDRLLSSMAVADYLAQVAPVPFSPDFPFGAEIAAALRPHVRLGDLHIRINGAEQHLLRPHRNRVEVGEGLYNNVTELEIRELAGVDGDGVGAIAWILHHEYVGALPSKALLKGIRLRAGNMQVGENNLLEELFPEPRFNSWAIGEIHVLDPKVIPNGRRDHFEQSVHFDNLVNQLAPITRDIAKRCRDSSIGRKWLREFATHKTAALERAKAVSRGGISRQAIKAYGDSVAKSLKAMRKIVATRYIGEQMRTELTAEADAVEARATKLLGGTATEKDPLERFAPGVRTAYQKMIALIYECASNNASAGVLVDRIFARLEEQAEEAARARPRSRGQKRRRPAT
jgi:hypothetical protein